MEVRLPLDLFTKERQEFASQWHRGKFADLDSEEQEMGDSVRRMRGCH